MPIIKSARKRVKTTKKATIRNAKTKRSLKEAVKNFTKSLGTAKAGDAHKKAQSEIDKAVKKNIIHKNKAARKQRQLSAAAKKAGVKPTKTVKTAAKKVVAKKPATKKAPAAKK
jgi:small subunit ribosomal protein S20